MTIQKPLHFDVTTGRDIPSTSTGVYVSVVQPNSFSDGQAVYFTGSAWALAQANSATTLGIGILANVTGDGFDVFTSGSISGFGSFTAGEYHFVSDSVAGQLTTTSPTAAGSARLAGSPSGRPSRRGRPTR